VSLTTPESVWALQEALHAKAKREPTGRFHSLYDKIYRKDVLLHAWKCCRANGGAPGVDGVTFEQIEQREDLSTSGGPPGLDTQTWDGQEKAFRNSLYQRSRGRDGSSADLRTDL
jgi:hypothetical protein